MKPNLIFVDDLKGEQKEKNKDSLFMGARSFALTKKHYGIQHGAQFEIHGVKFILDTQMGENEVRASDPYLVGILRAMEAAR